MSTQPLLYCQTFRCVFNAQCYKQCLNEHSCTFLPIFSLKYPTEMTILGHVDYEFHIVI